MPMVKIPVRIVFWRVLVLRCQSMGMGLHERVRISRTSFLGLRNAPHQQQERKIRSCVDGADGQ